MLGERAEAMLPAYVIEEILRRERERRRVEERLAEYVDPDAPADEGAEDVAEDEEPERGVTIVDFTI